MKALRDALFPLAVALAGGFVFSSRMPITQNRAINYIIYASLIALIIWLTSRWWLFSIREDPDKDPKAILEKELLSLPIEEVQRRALLEVEKNSDWTKKNSTGDTSNLLLGMNESILAVFKKYDLLEYEPVGTEISIFHLLPSECARGFLKIGKDWDGAEICVRGGEDTIFIFTEKVQDPMDLREETYRSIYDFLLIKSK